jgi:uncharacterized repeat protein (TIGR01451 family)
MRLKFDPLRSLTRSGPGRRALSALAAVSVITLGVTGVIQAAPSNFVNITNHQVRFSGSGTYDWANSGAAGGTNTCTGSEIHVSGINGLFDCGVFNGSTTPPTPPKFIPASDARIPAGARDFIVDPLPGDTSKCPLSTATVSGDSTVYTGQGSEKNGTLLSTDTWGSGSTPNKDQLANIYAVAHVEDLNHDGVLTPGVDIYEIYFGAERVVNNGDSHIDFEFLQGAVNLVAAAGSNGCSGTFDGNRSQGDLLLAVDFSTGGTLGSNTLYEWHCNADPGAQPAVGTVCNPPANGKSVPHYQQIGNPAVNFGVNDQGAVDCGGWACRNADGTQTTTIATNELMEGGIDLLALGFTGCLSSFLPHTRSSQSFTATLKDFALANFNTCNPTTTLSVSPSTSQLIHKGGNVTFNFSENNDGNVTLSNPHVDVAISPAGPTCTLGAPTGDTNSNGNLDPAETFVFSCTVTFSADGVFTITGTGHGTFNGNDITFPGDPDERAQTEVRVFTPATTLLKSASASSVEINGSVTYTYTETNGSTGGNGGSDLAISNVSVADDKCSPVTLQSGDANSNGKLDKTETWVFTCTANLATTTINTAIASGTDALGTTVTWCSNPGSPPENTICSQTERAQATVTVIHPATTLSKSVSAVVTATYTYKETNSGDVPLTNVSVTDDKCASVTFVSTSDGSGANAPLLPGATRTFTCTATIGPVDTDPASAPPLSLSVQNTATGHGTDPLLNPVPTTGETDKATVNVSVSHP